MNSRFRSVTACLCGLSLLALSACKEVDPAPPVEQPADDTADQASAQASISEAQAARIAALNRGDVDGVTSVYAPDAVLVIPDVQPLTDLASIRANFASLLGDDGVKMTYTPAQTWVSAGADFAVTTARVSVRSSDPENPVSIDSTSQSVWQRQPDGEWRIVSEYNVALPATQTTADAGKPDEAQELEVVPETVAPD